MTAAGPICPTCLRSLPRPDGILYDAAAAIVDFGGKIVKLRRSEGVIFELLFRRIGRPMTYSVIADQFYQLKPSCDRPVGEASLKVIVCRLRQRLAAIGLKVTRASGPGQGVMLVPPARLVSDISEVAPS